ncbi:MAG: chorismate synthase [Bacteroidales bacterium]|nr:chorismate synthase [Bacteroidales bacterium]
MMNPNFDTFGIIFRLTDEGDTHGMELSGVIENCPAGVVIDKDFFQAELARRAPSGDANSTKRKEPDVVEFTSGIINNMTTGEPIRFKIPNRDVKVDETQMYVIKPSHASFVYRQKYGAKSNEECGRASARQTVCRVVAGAIAKLYLRQFGIEIKAETLSMGQASCEGDSFGAKVCCRISNLPAGLGEPVYNKFQARLAFAMMSINAAKGFEIGEGFAAADMCGSQYNDTQNSDFSFNSNHDGGVQAGITNGQEVYFNVAFKPIPSIQLEQQTIDFEGNPVTFKAHERNDRCVVPRVLPVVEAMAAMVVADFMLMRV